MNSVDLLLETDSQAIVHLLFLFKGSITPNVTQVVHQTYSEKVKGIRYTTTETELEGDKYVVTAEIKYDKVPFYLEG